MKIVSWNVNGLAACKRKGFLRVLKQMKADVVCCQEIKGHCSLITPDYHQFWNVAERPGYSGTLVLAKKEPLSVQYSMGIEKFDSESRMIALEYEAFYIVNVYVPNSQSGLERLEYRIEWDRAFRTFLLRFNKPVILCGDFNVARDFTDIYPENLQNEEHPPGFDTAEREGMDALLETGLVDVFRTLNPEKEGAYTWWSNRLNKRQENRGWRLDYFLVSEVLLRQVRNMTHHTNILGSDHCPISLVLQTTAPRRELSPEHLADMWRGLDWSKLEDQLLAMQQSLARVAFAGHWEHVAELQKELVRSLAAKALAVRHVTQINSDAGIDGVKWTTDEDKMRAALSLTSKGYRHKPYRRFVLNDNGKERHINVPTAYDKAMQVLYAFALDPVAESTADKKSFAFRKGRSMLDAHVYLCQALEGPGAPEWVVKTDVKACYDTISHDWLMEHIPMDKKVLRQILKAGVAFGGDLFPTDQGISLGTTLSPILGNMALDGLQKYLYEQLYPDGEIDYLDGNLIRFADDIVITVRSWERADEVLYFLRKFLEERGLKLNQDKTSVSSTRQGFEFLSRWYQRKGDVLTVHPSTKAVQKMEQQLETFILNFKGSQRTLIERLNRKLGGWANYHRVTDTDVAFRRIDACVQALLIKKMRELHPKRKWKTIQNMYWIKRGEQHVFTQRNDRTLQVIRLADLDMVLHKPVRVGFHPYLDQEYYSWLLNKRDTQKVSGSKRRSVWQRQNGRCYYCGQAMRPDDEIELVEIMLGKGRQPSNMAYIHSRCSYDILMEDSRGLESLDVFALLDGVTEPMRGLEDPYWDLREFFRLCEKPSVTMTFREIEKMIGFELEWEAHHCKAFWFDEAPVDMGKLWAEEFPFKDILPSQLASEYVISEAWRSQGYRIQRLDLLKGKVTFHREIYGTTGLRIPTALTNGRIPENAAYEATTFFSYLIKKYGL